MSLDLQPKREDGERQKPRYELRHVTTGQGG
jgi:hypothetical protein